jgi:hypothetical protein
MSPGSSYRNDFFEYEDSDHRAEYRRTTQAEDGHPAPQPTNMPARSSKRRHNTRGKAKRAKGPATRTGMQRRRNKHWSW